MFICYSKLLKVSYSKQKDSLVFEGPLGCIQYPITNISDISFFEFKGKNFIYIEKSLLKNNRQILSNIQNIFQGLLFGFTKHLFLKGVGFRFNLPKTNIVSCKIGFSHLVYYYLPKKIRAILDNPTNIFLYSFDYSTLNNISVGISSLKKIDKYKGQGIYIL